MNNEVVFKAKEHLQKWRRDFRENNTEVAKFKVEDQNELYRELITFPKSETDYIFRLAEANLERVVISFNEKGKLDGAVYYFNKEYLIVYFDNNFVKWDTKTELDDCYHFFISLQNTINS